MALVLFNINQTIVENAALEWNAGDYYFLRAKLDFEILKKPEVA